MAVKTIDIVALADLTTITSSTAGSVTNDVAVLWDNATTTRHDVVVTLLNIASALLIEEQVTF